MYLISKLMTAVRGGARESIEVVVDANALRILEQEIYESEQALYRAKQDLTTVVAEKIRLKRDLDRLQAHMTEMENKTAQALREDQQDNATDYAGWIADNEPQLEDMREKYQRLLDYESRLTANLKKASRKLDQYRRELRMAKATASSQSASRRIYHRADSIGSKFTDMEQSLQRIQRIQQDCNDEMTARDRVEDALADELSPAAHSARPARSAEQVLQRIRESTAVSGEREAL